MAEQTWFLGLQNDIAQCMREANSQLDFFKLKKKAS